MSLFLKIFLWFWLAMALIVGVVFLVNWSTQSAPFVRQWRTFVGEAANVNSKTADQIYRNEGAEGLETYFRRLGSRRRVNAVALFRNDRSLIAGNLSLSATGDLFEKALASDSPQFLRMRDKTFAAKRVTRSEGGSLVYVIELKRFQAPPFITGRLLLNILAVVLTAGIVCYGLARYLSTPITILRNATKAIAGGDLATRISPKIRRRKDDLGYLAADFDEMAERIEALITSERRLTRDVSHELRSPLARINVALELARGNASPDLIDVIDRLEKESARLNDLIGQLLTLSKLETGSGEVETVELEVGELVEGVAKDADFEAGGSGNSVSVVGLVEARVYGNANLLRRALENIIRNAVRHAAPNTAVEVTGEIVEAEYHISVRDFGPGVPEEQLSRLFRPFYRIEEARDRRSGGSGLGLAIAERAIRTHEGRISASNSQPGLTVDIFLPIVRKAAS